MQTTQIFIAAFVLLAVALLVTVLAHLKRLRQLHGYFEIRKEIAAVERFLGGEIYRDREDLVVSGSLQRHRATVRFSIDDIKPALQLRVEVQSTFGFMVLPEKTSRQRVGERVLTKSEAFNSAWTVLSHEATETQLLLDDAATFAHIRKLCCSGGTYVQLEHESLDLSELTLPQDALAVHIIGHLNSMDAIAERLSAMPGAWRLKLDRVSRKRPTARVTLSVVLAFAVIAGIAELASYESDKRMQQASNGNGGSPLGIPPDEASHMPALNGWRLAMKSDFDPGLVSWSNAEGIPAKGRLEGDFRGGGGSDDRAYLLVNGEGAYRVVVALNNEIRFDRNFPSVALFARVPKDLVSRFPIDEGSAPSGEADAILIVRDKSDVHSALLLSFNHGGLAIAVPANYRIVSLRDGSE